MRSAVDVPVAPVGSECSYWSRPTKKAKATMNTTLQIQPETLRWRSREVRYYAGAWDDVLSVSPGVRDGAILCWSLGNRRIRFS